MSVQAFLVEPDDQSNCRRREDQACCVNGLGGPRSEHIAVVVLVYVASRPRFQNCPRQQPIPALYFLMPPLGSLKARRHTHNAQPHKRNAVRADGAEQHITTYPSILWLARGEHAHFIAIGPAECALTHLLRQLARHTHLGCPSFTYSCAVGISNQPGQKYQSHSFDMT